MVAESDERAIWYDFYEELAQRDQRRHPLSNQMTLAPSLAPGGPEVSIPSMECQHGCSLPLNSEQFLTKTWRSKRSSRTRPPIYLMRSFTIPLCAKEVATTLMVC